MYCRFCGNKIDDDSVFCDKCGKRQKDDGITQTSGKEDNANKSITLDKRLVYGLVGVFAAVLLIVLVVKLVKKPDNEKSLAKNNSNVEKESGDSFIKYGEDIIIPPDSSTENDNDVSEENNLTSGKVISGEDKTINDDDNVYHFEYCPVSAEIKNSKITDKIVQVGNTVISYENPITVAEVLDLLEKEGHVYIGSENDHHTEDSLIATGDTVEISRESLSECYPLGTKVICALLIVNPNETPTKITDCNVVYIGSANFTFFNAINIIYAGNICPYVKGGTELEERIINEGYGEEVLNAYKKRKEETPVLSMNYDEAKEYLFALARDAGLEATWGTSEGTIEIYDQESKVRKYIRLYYDLNQNRVSYIGYEVWGG